LDFPHKIDEVDTARKVTTFPFNYVTAGDISSDGKEVLIKNYLNVYYWKKEGAESIENLLNTTPLRLVYAPEPQGESIAWKTDGTGYLSLSEKAQASEVKILLYQRN
jgi:exonuclease I